ncbi:hypothetical protein LTR09_012616 [Extremus antarcticus]|uniref:Uncharacterized protein n=1 Tax=Extremus antarcticus TaxID=702011 RepID=A0AAJ0G4A1_9PEZI|nr:hypothetical protein LTR09_012616 [Extremus antarcticus]
MELDGKDNWPEKGEQHIEHASAAAPEASQATDESLVTPKTWIVILMLSLQFGAAFWPIPAVTAAGSAIATDLGDLTAAPWYVTSFVLVVCIAFMTCGANSDLFGRRKFILAGNILALVSNIVAGSAKSASTVIVGMTITGFGSGNCVVVTDTFLFVAILVGPVAGRYAAQHGETWKWLFYAPAILHALCFGGLYSLCYPPKHPRGVPWKEALQGIDWVGMDWVGMVLFAFGGTLNVFWNSASPGLAGVVLSLPPNLGLVFGGVLLVLFGSRIRAWKWTLTGSVVITVLFGALLGLVRPNRKGMMVAFVVINQICMGWGQYLSIAYTQLGVEQKDLGVSGGLSGVARNGGGVVALTVCTTILTNVQASSMKELVPSAAIAAGLPPASVAALLSALPVGETALSQVPDITQHVIAAALTAFQQYYIVALRTTALASLSFGIVSILACLWCRDIEDRMTDKIETFLENDRLASKNEFH